MCIGGMLKFDWAIPQNPVSRLAEAEFNAKFIRQVHNLIVMPIHFAHA